MSKTPTLVKLFSPDCTCNNQSWMTKQNKNETKNKQTNHNLRVNAVSHGDQRISNKNISVQIVIIFLDSHKHKRKKQQ